MKISWKMEAEKRKCNNHEIKDIQSFKYLGSKRVTKGSAKEEVTERIKKGRKMLPVIEGHTLEMGNA
jgi:hypothetical protein